MYGSDLEGPGSYQVLLCLDFRFRWRNVRTTCPAKIKLSTVIGECSGIPTIGHPGHFTLGKSEYTLKEQLLSNHLCTTRLRVENGDRQETITATDNVSVVAGKKEGWTGAAVSSKVCTYVHNKYSISTLTITTRYLEVNRRCKYSPGATAASQKSYSCNASATFGKETK